ncbi:MAG: VTT domain-containing protein [Myxococcota bacterium]
MRSFRFRLLGIVLLVVACGYGLARWVESVGGPEGIHARFGAAAPVVSGGVQLALAPTPFPSDLLAIAHGTLYGFAVAAPLNWIAWWLASLFQFQVGRRLGASLDADTELARLPNWLRRFPVGHPAFLILGRQIPWAGGHVTTWLPGAMGVPWRRYWWCSALSIVPGACAMAAIGAGLLSAFGD